MSAHKSSIHKYLNQYAEPEIQALELDWFQHNPQQRFHHVLAIPACNESLDFVERAINQFNNLLLIIVVNHTDTADAKTIRGNRDFLTAIHTRYPVQQQNKNISLLSSDPNDSNSIRNNDSHNQILLIDRCSQTIPEKQGVGLARKIACDIACQLIDEKIIRNPWIYSSDADAHLPSDYFQHLPSTHTGSHSRTTEKISAAVFNFQHKPHVTDKAITHATQLYETHLRYYQAGLAWAGSPYAFFTLGSTLAVHYEHYALVRGFPKRNAAEDFYLLNKLAKTGSVKSIPQCVIQLESRISQRVPFGTGPAVEKIRQLNNTEEQYCDYHPHIFRELKSLYTALDQFFLQQPELSLPLEHALQKIGFESALQHCRSHSKTKKQFLQHMHHWLDAFKILKLIHHLRDNFYPSLPYKGIQPLCCFYTFTVSL